MSALLGGCSFRLENAFNRDFTLGVDEVGRGPLAGPVVVAGVIFSKDFWATQNPEHIKLLEKIDDSKRLRPQTRETLSDFIRSVALVYEIVEVTPQTVDEINILQATFRGAREVVHRIEKKIGRNIEQILFDGPHQIPMIDRPQHTVIEGDRVSKSIAAASILAKVYRDQQMILYSEKYPDYGFEAHKGYGTRAHLEAIKKFGLTPIHRRSFLKKHQAADLGRQSEDRVTEKLKNDGFSILERNWRVPSAEIDIVATKDGQLHFFEVRSRSKAYDLQALFSKSKQMQVERAVKTYLHFHKTDVETPVRVHLATCIANEIEIYWDVFQR